MADARIDKGVNVYDFHSWLQHRERQHHGHVPTADLVVPLVAQAGRRGLTRGEIGKAVSDDLDRDALDDLLAGLVEFGLLAVTRENGLLVFRASGNIPIGLQARAGSWSFRHPLE
jgi:hypothetical protein